MASADYEEVARAGAGVDVYKKRSGKYRHIFGEQVKKFAFEDLKKPQTSGAGNYVAANRKYIAYAGASGGGPIFVLPHDTPGRALRDKPGITVHKGKVWDFDFHPFHNNVLGSGADDCRAAITVFPVGGLTEEIDTATQVFEGHEKKVTHVRFSGVTNLMATGSFDGTVRVWDIETAACNAHFTEGKGAVQSVEWNRDSTLLGMASKNKNLYTFDPRALDAAQTISGFEGSKSVKLTFLSRMGWLMATGVDKSAKRQMKVWDLRDTTKELYSQTLDSASSILVPRWDDDLGVLYTWGKGEGAISYYEIINDASTVYFLSSFRSTTPQAGGAWLPKAACNVFECEVQRFYKLTRSNTIVPIRFSVPRKAGADVFQSDIYPDAFGHKEALPVAKYWAGEDAQPVTMPMDPAKRGDEEDGGSSFKMKKSYAELEADHDALRAKYAAVKQRLAEADASYVPSDDADEKSGE